MSGARSGSSHLVIEPTRGLSLFRWREVWEYRELLYFLVWRDVKVRYKQTVLGVAWAILQPLLTMIVFTIFFGRLARVGSDELPYPLFSYTGLLIWTFFSSALTQASSSLIGSSNLITKVYFPRFVIPAAAVLSSLVDLAVAFPLLVLLLVYYGVTPGVGALLFPLVVVLALATALGFGLWLSALNVKYRDVRYAIPFLVQLWLFITPVIYPASTVTAWLEGRGLPAWLVAINPMTGVVEGFRWALLSPPTRPWSILVVSALIAAAALFSGAVYFRSMERSFADVV